MALINENLAAIQAAVDGILKESRHQKGYMFRGIEDFLNTMHPLLAEHKVTVFPSVTNSVESTFTTSQGKSLPAVSLTVKYKLAATDGSFEEATVTGYNYSSEGAHHTNATKDAYKTMLEQVFSIPTVKMQVAADNNGYSEPLVKEEKKPTTPVSSLMRDQLKNLQGIASRAESWDEYFDMVTFIEATPSLKNDPAIGGIAIGASKVLAAKDKKAFKQALMKAPNWKWYARIIIGANQASMADLTLLDASKSHMEKELGLCPAKTYEAIKARFK